MARHRRRSKKKSTGGIGAVILFLIIAAMFSKCGSGTSSTSRATPANVETMVKNMLDQDATQTMSVILSVTPTPLPTRTLIPTRTPKPTSTPWYKSPTPRPTNTPVPAAAAGSCHDISCGCKIWGNVNKNKGTKIYHCPNDDNYRPENFNAARGDRWFCTVAEATAEGFRAPKNAPPCGGL